MRNIMIFVLLLGAFAVTSCSGRRQGLDAALSAAGDNRPELEKVLAHYRSDPDRRKLKAAEYLISGMPGHYGLVSSPGLDSVKAVLADLYARRKVDSARLEQWRHFRPDNLKKAYDIETITADYLIRNIDMAFEDWDSRPWNRHLDFGEFCELLLPYRVGNEPLEDWRTEYRKHFRYITDSVYTGSDPVELVNTVFDTIIDSLFRYNVDFALPSLGGSWLMRNRIGGCRESCDFAVYLLRSIGVPVATDCYFHGSTHTWNVVLDTTGRYEPFWMDKFTGSRAVRGRDDGRVKGKVYRWNYGMSGRSADRTPRYIDVTSDYFGPNAARVRISRECRGGPVYLGFFQYRELVPQAAVNVHAGHAEFRDIEPGVAFVPIAGNGRIAGSPFYIDDSGETVLLEPDMSHSEDVTADRKTRATPWLQKTMDNCEGALIEGSSTPDFPEPVPLGVCGKPRINYNYIYPSSTKPVRYVRFTPREPLRMELGELRLFRDKERQDTIDVVLHSYSEPNRNDALAGNAIDGDELTYYEGRPGPSFLVLDLGREEHVRCIEWVPRNDDNFIRYGDTYELQYLDGVRGWRTVEGSRVTARDTVLHFSGVPGDALLRLHDMTRGVEEGVFIVEDGGQRFL